MKRAIVILFLFNCISLSLHADPSNPQASRGNITIVSSEFGEGQTIKKYPVSNAIDEDPQTAWVFEENATSFKAVKGLLFVFKSEVAIDGISLINGYAKSETLYKLNNAIKTFKIVLPNHHEYNYTCNETTNFQNFKFPKQNVRWMILIVTEERKGKKYNDLCISEISPTMNNEKLIYEQPKYLISNNGGEYESDLILNLQTNKQFNTDKFDFGCGAKNPLSINDSTIVYQDECDENSHIEVFYLNKMTNKTIKNKRLDNYTLINAISDTVFVIMKINSKMCFRFNVATNKFTSINCTTKKEFEYWRWSERLDSDLSDYYKKIE